MFSKDLYSFLCYGFEIVAVIVVELTLSSKNSLYPGTSLDSADPVIRLQPLKKDICSSPPPLPARESSSVLQMIL